MKLFDMKKITLLLILFVLFVHGYGQISSVENVRYKRSSLHTLLIESEKFPYKDTVIAAYYSAPFPDKYDNHTLDEKSFNPKLYGPIKADDKLTDYPTLISNYFVQNKVASKLVAKWFDRKPNGAMDLGLISTRGFYNATEIEAAIAQKSARGISLLADAGEELISNTFIVVSRLNFRSNEGIATGVGAAASVATSMLASNSTLNSLAQFGISHVTKKASEGYYVSCTSYLYQLVWNDSISSLFYNNYWFDNNHIDRNKQQNFNYSDLFTLKYIGSEKSSSLITYSLIKERSADMYVSEVTVRSIDAVYAMLQRNHDVFKTKTPLISVNPLIAKIGKKEGLVGGEKFEVLEQVVDNLGKVTYERKGVITVDKSKIWDNRYSLVSKTESAEVGSILGTRFKGSSSYAPGMLIRQIK